MKTKKKEKSAYVHPELLKRKTIDLNNVEGKIVFINPDYEYTYQWMTPRKYVTHVSRDAFKNMSHAAAERGIKHALRHLMAMDLIEFQKRWNKSNTQFSLWVIDTPDTAHQLIFYMKSYGYYSNASTRIDIEYRILSKHIDKHLSIFESTEAIDALLGMKNKNTKGADSCVKRVNLKYIIPIREWFWNGKLLTDFGFIMYTHVHNRYVIRYASRRMREITRKFSKNKGVYAYGSKEREVSFWYYPYPWRLSTYEETARGEIVELDEERAKFIKEQILDEKFDFDDGAADPGYEVYIDDFI